MGGRVVPVGFRGRGRRDKEAERSFGRRSEDRSSFQQHPASGHVSREASRLYNDLQTRLISKMTFKSRRWCDSRWKGIFEPRQFSTPPPDAPCYIAAIELKLLWV